MVTTELMQRISAAFNSRDVERIVDCFAEGATFCLARGPEPVGRTLKGKAAIRKALSDRFQQIPDMRWDHQEYILMGDRAVSLWTVRGRDSDGEELNYPGLRHLPLSGRQDHRQEHLLEDRRVQGPPLGTGCSQNSLSAPGGGEGWGEVGDASAVAHKPHLTLPRLRRGPLPLPPEGRRGTIC
jgi:ketosteroid isomerase-like protein